MLICAALCSFLIAGKSAYPCQWTGCKRAFPRSDYRAAHVLADHEGGSLAALRPVMVSRTKTGKDTASVLFLGRKTAKGQGEARV